MGSVKEGVVATGGAIGMIYRPIVLTLFYLPRYQYGQLIEINSHSLFSKWFSEVSIGITSTSQDC